MFRTIKPTNQFGNPSDAIFTGDNSGGDIIEFDFEAENINERYIKNFYLAFRFHTVLDSDGRAVPFYRKNCAIVNSLIVDDQEHDKTVIDNFHLVSSFVDKFVPDVQKPTFDVQDFLQNTWNSTALKSEDGDNPISVFDGDGRTCISKGFVYSHVFEPLIFSRNNRTGTLSNKTRFKIELSKVDNVFRNDFTTADDNKWIQTDPIIKYTITDVRILYETTNDYEPLEVFTSCKYTCINANQHTISKNSIYHTVKDTDEFYVFLKDDRTLSQKYHDNDIQQIRKYAFEPAENFENYETPFTKKTILNEFGNEALSIQNSVNGLIFPEKETFKVQVYNQTLAANNNGIFVPTQDKPNFSVGYGVECDGNFLKGVVLSRQPLIDDVNKHTSWRARAGHFTLRFFCPISLTVSRNTSSLKQEFLKYFYVNSSKSIENMPMLLSQYESQTKRDANDNILRSISKVMKEIYNTNYFAFNWWVENHYFIHLKCNAPDEKFTFDFTKFDNVGADDKMYIIEKKKLKKR